MSVGELLEKAGSSFIDFALGGDDRPILEIKLSNEKLGIESEIPYSGFTCEYEVGAGTGACSFNVPVPSPVTDNYNLLQLIMPVSDTRVIVTRNKVQVFNGFVDKWAPSIDSGGVAMNLQCRSATRDAIDSDWSKHFYFPSPTFQTIQRYTGTQEIYIFPQKTLRSVNIKKGQKIFEAFAKLASDTDGLWAIPTPNGQVEFVKLPSNRDPVASLKEGESPVMNVSTEFDLSKRFKDYIGIGVRAGQGSNVKITDKEIEDLGIQGRVKFVKASNEDANLREAVKRNMSLDLIESFTCVVNLSQWDIEGKLWQPGVLLELQAPANFIFKPYKFAVRKVSFRLDDSNGESCDLTLTLPNAFDNTPPLEVPWQLPSKQELNLLDQAKAFIGF